MEGILLFKAQLVTKLAAKAASAHRLCDGTTSNKDLQEPELTAAWHKHLEEKKSGKGLDCLFLPSVEELRSDRCANVGLL